MSNEWPEIKRNKLGRPILERKRSAEFQKLITPYAQSTGQVLWEWNGLHTALFRMFWIFIGNRGKIPRNLATDIWNSAQSDEHQRRMILAHAENTMFQHQPLLKRVRWIISVIGEFAAYRNLAAHAPMDIHWLESINKHYIGFALDGIRITHARKHVLVTFKKPEFWQLLAEDLYVLTQYTHQVGFYMTVQHEPKLKPLQMPLPYKPRLRTLPIVREVNRTVSQMGNKRRRSQSRRKASPEKS